MKILLLEDDPILGQAVEVLLRLEKYDVFWAKSLAEADKAHDFQLAILDIGLPDGSGIDYAKKLREVNPQLPFLFLTAISEENTLIEAFETGACDYIKKPFSNRELLVRVKANSREINSTEGKISRRGFHLELKNRIFRYQDKDISINPHQLKIFYFLLRHEGEVINRDQLLSFLGKENENFDRSIDTQISYLRKLLKENQIKGVTIKSVYGAGYKIEFEK